MKKNLLLSITLAATCMGGVKAQETLFDTPFSATYNNVTRSMPYRIPALVETENATTGAKELIYFADKRHCGMDVGWGSSSSWDGEVSSSNDYYRIDIVSRRSTDGGKSWSEMTAVKEGTASCGYGDVAVTSNWENPKEIVFFAATGNVKYGNSTRSNPLKTTRFYSKDGGQTWTSTDMTSAMYNLLSTSYTGLFFTSGRICQSKQIKVGNYYRIYSALCVYNGSTSNAFVVYSDDFGASWKLLGSGVAVSGGDESKVEELPNGNVLISSRIYSGYDSDGRRRFNVFKYNSLPTSANTANGSWGSYSSGIQYDSNKTKPCNGEILLVPAKDATGNSCYILLHSEPYGINAAEGRGNVSIFWKKLSSDNITSASEFSGKNWNRYSVSTTTSAYSTMILQHDGTIAFAYEETIWGNGSGAPSTSIDKITWGEHGYDLKYQNFTLETITSNQYTYDAGTVEEVKTVETPVITPNGGEFTGSATFEITCTTDDATIYYTTDGTDPATKGEAYTGKVTLTESATVKAIAMKEGWNNSELVEATFTIIPESTGGETVKVTKYRFKNVHVDGTKYYFTYNATSGLGLSSNESDAHLYTRTIVDQSAGIYNFQSEDGNYLVFSGRGLSNEADRGYNSGAGFCPEDEYTSEFCDLTLAKMESGGQVTSSFSDTYYTIKGKRYKASENSNVDVYFVIKKSGPAFDGASVPFYNDNYSSAFVIEEVEVEVEGGEVEKETVATPVIAPASGTFTGSATVTITCATDGATIYYSTDGTEPGTEYTGTFTLSKAGTYTVKAIAKKNGSNDSEVTTATITVKEEVVVETVEWSMSVINCSKESCQASSYSTLYLDYAVAFPSEVKVYRGVLDTEKATLTLYRIRTGIIPAQYAVIIEDTQARSSITLTKTDNPTTTLATNDLQGSLTAMQIANTADYYVLGHTAAHHVGFYHPNSTTLAANKAYVEWGSSNARALIVKRSDEEGDATDIENPEFTIQNSELIYDLMGRRVDNPTRGMYIINGKKVFIQ